MGRLLEALRADSEPGPVAIPAIPAIFPQPDATESQNRKNRRGYESEKQAIGHLRDRLLRLADAEGLPLDMVHCLPDAEVAACDGQPTETLRAYLRALGARERMDKGLAPIEWGEPVARTCEGCRPVLLWATCPPVVKACPWCFRRKAGKPIARPKGER